MHKYDIYIYSMLHETFSKNVTSSGMKKASVFHLRFVFRAPLISKFENKIIFPPSTAYLTDENHSFVNESKKSPKNRGAEQQKRRTPCREKQKEENFISGSCKYRNHRHRLNLFTPLPPPSANFLLFALKLVIRRHAD